MEGAGVYMEGGGKSPELAGMSMEGGGAIPPRPWSGSRLRLRLRCLPSLLCRFAVQINEDER